MKAGRKRNRDASELKESNKEQGRMVWPPEVAWGGVDEMTSLHEHLSQRMITPSPAS